MQRLNLQGSVLTEGVHRMVVYSIGMTPILHRNRKTLQHSAKHEINLADFECVQKSIRALNIADLLKIPTL